MIQFRFALLVAPFVTVVVTMGAAEEPAGAAPEAAKFFEENVRPLLLANCFQCHGPEEQEADLRLDSLASMKLGGESGPAIEPGKPEESLLVEAINYQSLEMPPEGQLDDDDIETLTAWIKMGAPWPGSEEGSGSPLRKREKITDEDRAWWAFQPVKDPAVPELEDDDWSRNEIDHFVLLRLQVEGLQPSGEADKRQLIRRLYFDLIGLPPKPEEVQAFLLDMSPDAYEKLVARLLDSPTMARSGRGTGWMSSATPRAMGIRRTDIVPRRGAIATT